MSAKVKISISYFGRCAATDQNLLSWTPIARILDGRVELVPCGSKTAKFFISFEHSPTTLKLIRETVPVSKRLLVIFEPPAVNPAQHSSRVRSLYAKVLVPSKLQVRQANEIVYFGGALHDQNQFESNLSGFFGNDQRSSSFCLVQQNKFSLVKNSNYSLRQKVAEAFQKRNLPLCVAGRYWDIPQSRLLLEQLFALRVALMAGSAIDWSLWRWNSLRSSGTLNLVGEVENSIAFASRHAVALVIENDPSYVTEKLFNALQAGCAVIYCGPDLKVFGIPQGVVKQVPCEVGAVLDAAEAMTPDEIASMKSGALTWLQRHDVRETWGYENSFNRIADFCNAFIREGLD